MDIFDRSGNTPLCQEIRHCVRKYATVSGNTEEQMCYFGNSCSCTIAEFSNIGRVIAIEGETDQVLKRTLYRPGEGDLSTQIH